MNTMPTDMNTMGADMNTTVTDMNNTTEFQLRNNNFFFNNDYHWPVLAGIIHISLDMLQRRRYKFSNHQKEAVVDMQMSQVYFGGGYFPFDISIL